VAPAPMAAATTRTASRGADDLSLRMVDLTTI
jgi:hypothetical protein